MNSNLINRFISAMGELSDSDISTLAEALRDPKLSHLMAESIEAIYNLRSGSTKRESNGELSLSERELSLEKKLSSALFNKKTFKSSRDLVDALNNYFDLEIPDPSKSKESRARIIERTLKTINEIPNDERRKLVLNFLDLVSQPGADYDALFKFLANRE